jgi:hypothetical protein
MQRGRSASFLLVQADLELFLQAIRIAADVQGDDWIGAEAQIKTG